MASLRPAIALLFLSSCFSPPVEAPKTTVEATTTVQTGQNIKDEVDLLFLVDDSGSMAPKQEALKQRFPALIAMIEGFATQGHKASYHIGVVTSDLGAPGIACGSNLGGKLQQRGLAKSNTPGCVGPVGKPYIDYDQRSGVDNFSSTGQTLEQTFSCMASVVDPDGTAGGHTGCGFESQLEAVYRALHDPIPENAGFLRPDALLAVVWITDEDDCSVDPTSDLFGSNPAYGPLDSYRCAQFGIVCDGMLLPSTPQASFGHCAPATPADGGKLTNLDKYVHFFTDPMSAGGLKADPSDVILAAITAPKDPVATVSASGNQLCGSGVSTCTNVAHSCVAPDDAAFFGDPSQRLSYVVEKASSHQLTSICDEDYTAALQGVGAQIRTHLSPSCLKAPIADVLHPDCTVEDVTAGGVPTSIPFCGSNGGAAPCWRLCNADDPTNAAGCTPAELIALAECSQVCNPHDHTYQVVAIDIERGGAPVKPDTTAHVACNTIAIANEDPDAACR